VKVESLGVNDDETKDIEWTKVMAFPWLVEGLI
jgi:hypothetical protein